MQNKKKSDAKKKNGNKSKTCKLINRRKYAK